VNRLRGEQADREREVQGLAQRAAGLKVEAERQDAEKAERESRMEQSQAQVKTLEAEAERLTRQAAEQTRVAEEAAERVAALQAEGQRLTATARTAWARARLRYLLTGAAGGMALLAIVATIVVLLSRAVH
jgi:dTMP kinase